MGALGVSEYIDVVALRLEAERKECEWLLNSGALGRSGNLTRILRYVCEEYFQGRADQIKEYTIAVEALGRRPEFDPQTDTIVRVTVHALRKRLMDVYRNEGVDRPLHLVLPPGHYAPSFVPQGHAERWPEQRPPEEPSWPANAQPADAPAAAAQADPPLADTRRDTSRDTRRVAWTAAILCSITLAVAVAAVAIGWGHAASKTHPVEAPIFSSGAALPPPQTTIHALMGKGRAAYVDHSGVAWTDANYCRSGTSVNLPSQHIEGTEDTPLYLAGVRGIVHCAFPVPPGMYEVRLHFSDTSVPGPADPPMSTRDASFAINSGDNEELKVVDEAGGHNIALPVVITGVQAENDGAIHLDYVSEVSLLNAVEVLPAPSAKQLPVRIVAGTKAFVDDAKQVWDADRYFSGGRHGQQLKLAHLAGQGLYGSSRVGRFRYNIPAVPFAHYRVKLYFRDPWFGKDNGGDGGPGSRVFDVACNGAFLLKNFDILAEGDSRPVVKTFENVQATAAGRIELFFMPVVNYPAVSAIEVVPED